MPQVQRIDPIVIPSEKVTVAAYCRVSTNSEDQANSYNTQIAYYAKLISENPDWELVDIYADRGISGTSMAKRDEFNHMLADCREGKIKRVLVKSVSRFARNTTELLQSTRELKDLGVVVVFEEQGYDISQVLGEMQLAMYAMAAQEESHSISKNIRWSIQKRMASGSFVGSIAPYGYIVERGELKIQPEEAAIVRLIFDLFLSGKGQREIVQYLNNRDICFSRGAKWTRSCVKIILANERYTGDALLQKKYVENTLTHKLVENKGERQQFYAENHHEPIISKETFMQAKNLARKRGKTKSCADHLFTHKILCPDCNRHFREVDCSGMAYWICPNRANRTTSCTPYRYSESQLMMCAVNMIAKIYLNQNSVVDSTIDLLREVEYTQSGTDTKLFELDQSIAALNNKSLTLQKLSNKGFISPEEYRLQNEALATQRKKLTAERNKKLHGLQSHSAIEKLEELQAILSSCPGVPTEFDIDQFDEVVEKIIPTADNKLIFRLHCGLELTEDIPS